MADRDLRPLYKADVVGICGPPHSGKSVMLAALYSALLALRPQNFTFLIRANPDGEGMWSQETSEEIRQIIRQKGEFTPEIEKKLLSQFVGSALMGTKKWIPIDLGGRRSEQNAHFLRHCTYFICLSSKEEEIEPWVSFAEAQGCKTLAIMRSRLVKFDDRCDLTVRSNINLSSVPVQAELVNLDRDAGPVCYAEAISQFARWLVKYVEGKN